MAGYFLDNTFAFISGAYLSDASRVPVDTNLVQGAFPQSGGMLPGQMAAPAAQIALTAHAGGGQTLGTQLTFGANNVTVVATAADSVKLPPALAGATCFVMNSDAADSMQVFGGGTSTINGVATATGVAQAAGKGALYVCISGDGTDVAGAWVRALGA